ncbi:hypothetical protein SLEP1_g58421 [Rubroshorea leprosula]|uniref:Uncharacterized protein n=1 Tax=Rubroshorea leprosula TaxID=152421 RepID=A0AAV5MQH5_9ROSI|nr:hypothetical protein SLEP1_g58421 [Rubroshorea leprosula]
MAQKNHSSNKMQMAKGKGKTASSSPVPTRCSKCQQFVRDIEALVKHQDLAKRNNNKCPVEKKK